MKKIVNVQVATNLEAWSEIKKCEDESECESCEKDCKCTSC